MLLNKEKYILETSLEDWDLKIKTNNKKAIKKTITSFTQDNYTATNKGLKKHIKDICDMVDKGFINVDIVELIHCNKVVSYVFVTTFKEVNLCVLGMLHTIPEYRGHGLASKLVKILMLTAEMEELPFVVELHKDEVLEKRNFYGRLGLNITATGLLPTNIAISNQENFDMIEHSKHFGVQEAA
ncbi:GNAT family N-acetyltransferase [Vibrio harveyi]|uniref:GNAT family N-acetyltransferase n=1 Tax=Vibrio harveyi TaxID=669 RepID=UPI0023807DFD|nr:GNAT family N-acetyltransferase [Vibrio harveyi]